MSNAIYRNKLLRTLRVNRSSKTFVVDRNIVIDSRNGSDGFECMKKKKKNYTIKILSKRIVGLENSDRLITLSNLIPKIWIFSNSICILYRRVANIELDPIATRLFVLFLNITNSSP